MTTPLNFWKITWKDGKVSKWSMKLWSAIALEAALTGSDNVASVEAVES